MFRNSIKEKGEPPLGEASFARRDSLTQLHDLIRSTSVDGHVSSILYSKSGYGYLSIAKGG